MKVNRHSPKRLMFRFDFLETASKLWHMFLLLLFYVDVAPAKTQAEDTDSALQSGLCPPHHLCQTGEQKVCSCVLCLQFLTAVSQVCNLRSQHNDRVCPARAHTHLQKLARKRAEAAPWSHDAWANIRLFCPGPVSFNSIVSLMQRMDNNPHRRSLLDYKSTFCPRSSRCSY